MKIKLNSIYQANEMREVASRLPAHAIDVKASVAYIPQASVDAVLHELEVSRAHAKDERTLSIRPAANGRGRANAIGSVKRAIAAARDVG